MFFSIIGYTPLTYGEYVYPDWANALGWVIASLSLICVPIGAVHELATNKEPSLLGRLKNSLRPRITARTSPRHGDEKSYLTAL